MGETPDGSGGPHVFVDDLDTPVLSDEVADAYGDDLTTLLNTISAAIDTDTLTELNKRFDIDKEDAADIAADFIADAGL